MKVIEARHISWTLEQNGYPGALICHRCSQGTPEALPRDKTEWNSFTVVPYIRGVSESLRHVLAPLGVRVCFKPLRNLQQILSKPLILMQSGRSYMPLQVLTHVCTLYSLSGVCLSTCAIIIVDCFILHILHHSHNSYETHT